MSDIVSLKQTKPRDTAIDFVKFIALFLVLNSHMGDCYPKYQFLATGGAIGDALFFFASGFTLFLGRGTLRFDEWYKRRIKRIYPSVIAVALISAFIFRRNDTFFDVIIAKQYWFIQCIFVLYPFLYLAKKYVSKHIALLLALTVIIMAAFPFIYKREAFFWGGGYYRWTVYLLFMLLGAILGKERSRIKQMNVWIALSLILVCSIAWYGTAYLFKDSVHLFISIIPMMGVAAFTYCLGRSKPLERLLDSNYLGPVIISIGALCLESYLIQKLIITSEWNDCFPWNIPLIMILVLFASFCAKLLANLVGQLFDSQPIDWRSVFCVY